MFIMKMSSDWWRVSLDKNLGGTLIHQSSAKSLSLAEWPKACKSARQLNEIVGNIVNKV